MQLRRLRARPVPTVPVAQLLWLRAKMPLLTRGRPTIFQVAHCLVRAYKPPCFRVKHPPIEVREDDNTFRVHKTRVSRLYVLCLASNTCIKRFPKEVGDQTRVSAERQS